MVLSQQQKLNKLSNDINNKLAKEIRDLEYPKNLRINAKNSKDSGKKHEKKKSKFLSGQGASLNSEGKNKLRFYRSLYENMCWEEFNNMIKKIQKYALTQMYKNSENLSERELMVQIHNELMQFNNWFMSNCRSRGIPKSAVKKTKAYELMNGLTNSYKIYYKNAKVNLNTKKHKNKFTYFKMKLNQVSLCGLKKVKNTPFQFAPFKVFIDFHQFVDLVPAQLRAQLGKEGVKELFDQFDTGNTGSIQLSEMKLLMNEIQRLQNTSL